MTTPARRLVAGDNLVWFEDDQFRILDAVGPDVVKYIEDFVGTVVTADVPAGWAVTLVEAGAGETTVARSDGSGGRLLITTDANEDDGANLQLLGEAFALSTSQALTYFGIRLQCGEATQSDILVGLCITDTTLLGGMTDGVYFEKLDGGTSWSFVTEKNSTETQTDTLGTLAADTWVTLEFAFDGTRVFAWIDGVRVATHTTNIPDDEALTPSIHFLSGNAAVETLTIDWVRAIQVGR